MNVQHIENQKNKTTLILAVIGLFAGLIIGFSVGVVYAVEDGNVTDQSQGLLINSYVENVKQDICPTLDNQTEIQECLKL